MKNNYLVQISIGLITLIMYFLFGAKGPAIGLFFSSVIILIVNKLCIKKKKNEIKLLCITNFSENTKDQKDINYKLKVGNSTLLILVLYFIIAILWSEANIIEIQNDINYLTFFVPGLFLINGLFGFYYSKKGS